jgi:hypothetical protein
MERGCVCERGVTKMREKKKNRFWSRDCTIWTRRLRLKSSLCVGDSWKAIENGCCETRRRATEACQGVMQLVQFCWGFDRKC